MYHSFIRHSLISFFHNFTNGSICNVISYFQSDQFVCNCLHSPKGSFFWWLGAGYSTDSGFNIIGYLAVAIFLLLVVKSIILLSMTKRFAIFESYYKKPYISLVQSYVQSSFSSSWSSFERICVSLIW